MSANSFVPTRELQNLTRGSYEHFIHRLGEEVDKNKERFFGADGKSIRILGTYPGYAVVACNNGKFSKIRFEESKDKVLKITGSELLNVPVYDASNPESISEFVLREAREVVALFLKGHLAESHARLADIVPFIDNNLRITDQAVASAVVEWLASDRTWKSRYQGRSVKIRQFIADRMPDIEKGKLESKFHKLYDGSITESDLSSYGELVATDLRHLSDRLTALRDVVESALKKYDTLQSTLNKSVDREELLTFSSFANDLFEDIKVTVARLGEALRLVKRPDLLGKVYDSLAEELYFYEVAGCFVSKVAKQLAEEISKGV